mmetsp:Transcript_48070/g.121306  ORF Transcript_48070/g.121306 Transcript_48070/m.121306 type:complete len:403 (+) Transcript_48070:642-1850(+)
MGEGAPAGAQQQGGVRMVKRGLLRAPQGRGVEDRRMGAEGQGEGEEGRGSWFDSARCPHRPRLVRACSTVPPALLPSRAGRRWHQLAGLHQRPLPRGRLRLAGPPESLHARGEQRGAEWVHRHRHRRRLDRRRGAVRARAVQHRQPGGLAGGGRRCGHRLDGYWQRPVRGRAGSAVVLVPRLPYTSAAVVDRAHSPERRRHCRSGQARGRGAAGERLEHRLHHLHRLPAPQVRQHALQQRVHGPAGVHRGRQLQQRAQAGVLGRDRRPRDRRDASRASKNHVHDQLQQAQPALPPRGRGAGARIPLPQVSRQRRHARRQMLLPHKVLQLRLARRRAVRKGKGPAGASAVAAEDLQQRQVEQRRAALHRGHVGLWERRLQRGPQRLRGLPRLLMPRGRRVLPG